jgi:hypothetical protein
MQFWGEAIKMANFLKNRLTTRICGDKTPMEMWSGRKPTIAYIKTFGCKVFACIPKPNQNGKLGARAERGMFLGFDENRKAALVWITDSCQLISSRDVRYSEDEEGWKESHIGKEETEKKISINLGKQQYDEPEEELDSINIDDLHVENLFPEGTAEENGTISSTRDDQAEIPINQSRYSLRPRTDKVRPEKYAAVTTKGKRRPEEKKDTLEGLIAEFGRALDSD